MEGLVKLEKKIISIDLIVIAVLIVLSLFFTEEPAKWIKGYIFGGLIGILNFILLGKTVCKAVKMPPSAARAYGTFNYFIRMFITGVVITIGLKADYLSAISVIIGILVIKPVIYISEIFGDREFLRKTFGKRKEVK